MKSMMLLALIEAQQSPDPKTKVGAVIVSKNNDKIISTGYNQFTKDIPTTKWDSDEKHNYVIHAEQAAIVNAKENLWNSILYTTLYPCPECARLIAYSGIKFIFYLKHRENSLSAEIFRLANITTICYNFDQNDLIELNKHIVGMLK